MTEPTGNLIEIPFNAFSRERLAAGMKTATSRTKRYGQHGDYFYVDGRAYVLTHVVMRPLRQIAGYYWKEEGAVSPQEFVKVWEEIHPRKGYDPDWEVWYHAFERCPQLDEQGD